MLTVTRRILISAPRDSVKKYLSDLREIVRYEPKVDAIEPVAESDSVLASGRFFGVPWHGSFRFEMTIDGGYRGIMVQGPLRSMECRFALRLHEALCRVGHLGGSLCVAEPGIDLAQLIVRIAIVWRQPDDDFELGLCLGQAARLKVKPAKLVVGLEHFGMQPLRTPEGGFGFRVPPQAKRDKAEVVLERGILW